MTYATTRYSGWLVALLGAALVALVAVADVRKAPDPDHATHGVAAVHQLVPDGSAPSSATGGRVDGAVGAVGVGRVARPPALPRSGSLVRAQQPAVTAASLSSLASDGIPTTALAAYRRAAAAADQAEPSCHISWSLLAGIGRVESDHGRFAGAQLRTDGTSTIRIIGIPLDGVGTARITDTDHGLLDGDRVYDRAVGPMQFIPSTWATWGADGDHDGRINPFDINDAALAAANYLCAAGSDLATQAGQVRAVLTYNHDSSYVATVLALAHAYATGTVATPITVLPPGGPAALPPADPGPPAAVHAPTSTHPATQPNRPSGPGRPTSAPAQPTAQPTSQPTSHAPTSTAPTSMAPTTHSGSPTSPPSTTSAPTSSTPTTSTPTTSTPASPCPTGTAQPTSTSTPSPSPSGTSTAPTASSTASPTGSSSTAPSGGSSSCAPSGSGRPSPSPTGSSKPAAVSGAALGGVAGLVLLGATAMRRWRAATH